MNRGLHACLCGRIPKKGAPAPRSGTPPDGYTAGFVALSFASSGTGTSPHMSAEFFKLLAGVKILHVPYKGSTAAHPDLIGGRVSMMFDPVAAILPHIKSGRVRALGVTSKHRSAELPDVPPIGDTLPGYEARGWNGVLAPAGTPRPVIERLNREIVKVVRSPEFNQILVSEGATSVGNTPAEFDAVIRADVKKWAKIIKEAGIRAE